MCQQDANRMMKILNGSKLNKKEKKNVLENRSGEAKNQKQQTARAQKAIL